MNDLSHHPKLRQLARNLHIPDSGDCLLELRRHAIDAVSGMLKDFSVETIDELRLLVADNLSAKIERIEENSDVERLSEKYRHVATHFGRVLKTEFLKSDTEGLLIDNPKPGKGGRDYLIVVDARGSRRARAYFTIWHELAHLLLYPRRQLILAGFRRTPTSQQKERDPLERAVDQIAGLVGFWEPLFAPALRTAARDNLSFRAIEDACGRVAPGASFFAACLAASRVWSAPCVFLTAKIMPRSDGTAPALRLHSVVADDRARKAGCKLREHMRVPPSSVLSHAFNDFLGRGHKGVEDQSQWEVSGKGSLPSLEWRVEGIRRGDLVYGLATGLSRSRKERRSVPTSTREAAAVVRTKRSNWARS